MKKVLFFTSIVFLFSYLSCVNEDDTVFKYPRVDTNPVDNITSNGARFNATIEYSNIDQITQFGFVWGESPELSNEKFSIPADTIIGNSFYAEIRSSLKENKTYYIRSFVIKGKKVYGDIVSFKSLGSEGPKITALNPQVAAFGDTVTLTGKNFTSNGVLKYGRQDISSSIVATKKNRLRFVLPDSLPVSPSEDIVSLSIEGNLTQSPVPLKLDLERILPKMISVTPSIVGACDTITIHGKNLTVKKFNVSVYSSLGNLEVIKATRDSVMCVVKRVPSTDGFDLGLYNGRYYTANTFDLVKEQPEVISVSPTFYKSKDIITIKVKNFPYCDNSMYTYINGIYYPNTSLTWKSKDEIQLQLPEGCLGTFGIIFQFSTDIYPNIQSIVTPLLSPEPPIISSIQPSHGSFGDEIIITGSKLKRAVPNFLDTISTSDTEIRGRVNQSGIVKENGFTDVEIFSCGIAMKENGFKYDPLQILDFNPKTVTTPSQLITITGKNFSTTENKITIGSYTTYLPSSDNQTIIVPLKGLMPDITQSIHQSVDIKIENSLGNAVTASMPLQINYDASWVHINDFPFSAIYLGISFSLDGKGYVGGNGTSSNFWQYDPATNDWVEKAFYPGTAGRYRVSAIANGKAYVGLELNQYKEWWEYDPATDTWNRKQDYPGSAPVGGFSFGLGDRVYVGTGQSEFWEYNPTTDTWSRKPDMPLHNVAGTLNFAFKGKGYVYGTTGGAQYENTYDPNTNSWASRSIGYFERSSNNKYMIFEDYVVVGGESLDVFGKNAFLKIVPGSGMFENAPYAGIYRKGPVGFAIGNYGYWGLGINSSGYQESYEIWKIDPSKF